jgi:hypothetical protein
MTDDFPMQTWRKRNRKFTLPFSIKVVIAESGHLLYLSRVMPACISTSEHNTASPIIATHEVTFVDCESKRIMTRSNGHQKLID